jgi:predicted small lipoprotein YifL
MHKLAALSLSLLLLTGLTACGQKGPLILPESTNTTAQTQQ